MLHILCFPGVGRRGENQSVKIAQSRKSMTTIQIRRSSGEIKTRRIKPINTKYKAFEGDSNTAS